MGRQAGGSHQIALISGAKVIVTSSSAAKLERAVTLLTPLAPSANAIATIDYSKIDNWDQEARRLNGGKGVDFVIEIGGRGTIARSIRSTKQGGLVAVSGEFGRIYGGPHVDANGRIHERLQAYSKGDFG